MALNMALKVTHAKPCPSARSCSHHLCAASKKVTRNYIGFAWSPGESQKLSTVLTMNQRGATPLDCVQGIEDQIERQRGVEVLID